MDCIAPEKIAVRKSALRKDRNASIEFGDTSLRDRAMRNYEVRYGQKT